MTFATAVSTLAFLVASAALVMVIWPIVSAAPWEEDSSSTVSAQIPKKVTSPALPNPSGQPTLSGKVSRLERCLSAYQTHTHTYSPTDVSHSHSLESMFGSYSISPHRTWGIGMGETTSEPKVLSLGC